MRFILNLLVRVLPAPRVIYDREGGTPYLSRWYLIGAKPDEDAKLKGQVVFRETWLTRLPFNLYLHRFHRSDDDGALHNHPWRWSLSFILAGGYSEERRATHGDAVERRMVTPWSFNFIRGTDYHRVDLIESDAWSLFFVGPKVGTWFFWDRATKRRAQWRRFVMAKRGMIPDAGWEPDAREAGAVSRTNCATRRCHIAMEKARMIKTTDIELGDTAKDTITGFTGTVVAETRFLNGCMRMSLQATELKDGKPVEWQAFDVEQLALVERAKPRNVEPSGGPREDATQRPTVARRADPTR